MYSQKVSFSRLMTILGMIESPPQQVAEELRLVRKFFIFYSLVHPAASSGECARCSVQDAPDTRHQAIFSLTIESERHTHYL